MKVMIKQVLKFQKYAKQCIYLNFNDKYHNENFIKQKDYDKTILLRIELSSSNVLVKTQLLNVSLDLFSLAYPVT